MSIQTTVMTKDEPISPTEIIEYYQLLITKYNYKTYPSVIAFMTSLVEKQNQVAQQSLSYYEMNFILLMITLRSSKDCPDIDPDEKNEIISNINTQIIAVIANICKLH